MAMVMMVREMLMVMAIVIAPVNAPCIEAAGQMRNWCIPVHFDTMPSFLKYLKAVFFWKLRLVMIVRIARQ